MLEALSQLDSDIFLFFNNGFRSQFFDRAMMLFTGKFIWVPMYATLLLLFARTQRWRVLLAFTVCVAAAIALTDQTCATLIRPMVERLRPSNLSNPMAEFARIVDGYRGGSYGFPSCHAANSFALAVFMAMAVGRRSFTLFIIGWVIMNSYSRLYIGVHYPGDLVVGALIGSAFGAMMCVVARRMAGSAAREIHESDSIPVLMIPIGIGMAPILNLRSIAVTARSVVIAVGASTVAAIVLISL